MKNKKLEKIVIFGASGYIGQRMVKKLSEKYELHLFNRNKCKLAHFNKIPNLHLHDFPLIEDNKEDLVKIIKNSKTVFHLIHSMSEEDNSDFLKTELELAQLIAEASVLANVENITYLGGLGSENIEDLSVHLRSRQLTGDTLRKYTKNTSTSITEFRAGVIIGAGGSSFEIIRTLATKLPFIPVLFKKEGLCEPIFVDNVINFLKKSIDNKEMYDKILEIGNGEKYTYSELVQKYSNDILKKKLYIINLSFLSFIIKPKLIGKIISIMTGQPTQLIIPLIYGVKNDATVTDKYRFKNIIDTTKTIFKKNISLNLAYNLAADREQKNKVQSVWDTPTNLSNLEKKSRNFFTTQEKEGLLYEEVYKVIKDSDVDNIFNEIKNIGNKNSRYWSPYLLWKTRGYIDKLFGGPGVGNINLLNREELHVGDRIDFWTVESIKEFKYSKELRLIAEMKTPGKAWLQFKIVKNNEIKNSNLLYLRAYFEPHGILGYIYWYSLYIVHKFIFKTMINNICSKVKCTIDN